MKNVKFSTNEEIHIDDVDTCQPMEIRINNKIVGYAVRTIEGCSAITTKDSWIGRENFVMIKSSLESIHNGECEFILL